MDDHARERAAVLGRIARQAPGIVVAVSRDGDVVLSNEGFDALPAACEAGGEGTTPPPSREALLAACRRVLETGLAEAVELGESGPGGATRWYQGTVAPVTHEERTAAAIAVCVDVTAQKRREEHLRHRESLVVDAEGIAHLGIWEWDPRGQRVVWTDELYRLYGTSPDEFQPTFEAYVERVHPDDRQRVRDVMARALADGTPFSHDERIVRADGAVRHLHTWGHPVFDASGALVRLVGVCQDITERKLAEEALRHSLADLRAAAAENARLYLEAQRAVELRDEFLSIASHELRTPITPVVLQLQVLGRSLAPGDRLRATVAACEAHVKRLAKVIDTLLDVSRISGGPITLNCEEVDLSALTREVVERHAGELARAGCEVKLRLAPDLVGWWDRVRLEEVVASLLGNAMKFGAGKPIELRTSLGATGAMLAVRDCGIGVPPADRTRIFERFERAVSARSYGGLGLGLYVTRQIAEAHGGSIRVEGEPGEGATFVVELPLKNVLAPSR